MSTVRTDLAMEACSLHGNNIPGICVEGCDKGEINWTKVTVETEQAAERIGKEKGVYTTLCFTKEALADIKLCESLAELIAIELATHLPSLGDVLVIGLGNRHITADALGTSVVERTLVTRHLKGLLPHELNGRLRGVCAVAPGVLGVTGVETAEVVKGLVERVRPAAVIAVDALSAMACDRIGSTVQITDTGITPGSGVGNHRSGITSDTMGVPVIAVGVPMVVYALTIVRDALSQFKEEETGELAALSHFLSSSPLGDLVVTPREIDLLVEQIGETIAKGINQALQNKLTADEIKSLMH